MNNRSADEQARLDRIEHAMAHWHRRELDGYFTLYRSDAILHHTHGDFDLAGAYADYQELFRTIPDAKIAFRHTIVEGECVAMTFIMTGTVDGQAVERRGLSLLQFIGLECVERWTSSHDPP